VTEELALTVKVRESGLGYGVTSQEVVYIGSRRAGRARDRYQDQKSQNVL